MKSIIKASEFLYFENNGPTNVGMYRSISYYQQLLKLNCKFLDKHFKLEPKILEKIIFAFNNFRSIAIERALRGYKTAITGQLVQKHARASVY